MFRFEEISIPQLERLRTQGKLALIDVRSEAETARGIIEGAIRIPMHLLPAKVNELDDSVPIVLYCHVGARSAQACAFLGSKGFRNIYNLQGGMMAWLKSGLPLSDPA